jgi:hypothetical protein
VAGSPNSGTPVHSARAPVAQWIELPPSKRSVVGSIPTGGAKPRGSYSETAAASHPKGLTTAWQRRTPCNRRHDFLQSPTKTGETRSRKTGVIYPVRTPEKPQPELAEQISLTAWPCRVYIQVLPLRLLAMNWSSSHQPSAVRFCRST